jgi:multiple sugar transport system substrate-binding protein
MKKVSVLMVCLLLLAVGSLFSAAQSEEEGAMSEAEMPEEVTLTFAATSATGNVLEARNRTLGKFSDLFPHITVEREELPHSQFWVKIPVEIAAGNAPDVITLPYLEQAVTFAAKGMLAPLDSYIKGENGLDLANWYPEVLELGAYGGKQMVLPQMMMLTGLGYNKDMFDAAGVSYPTDDWTWNDLLAAAKKLTLDVNGNNAESKQFDDERIEQWGIYTWWWNSDFDLYLWTFGGDWLNAAGTDCLLDSPQAIEAIQFYGELTQKHHVAPYQRELHPAHGHGPMMDKKVAMAFVDIGNINNIDGSGINWDMSVVPYKKDVGKRTAFMFGDGVAVLEKSQNKDAAWNLAKFVASEWDTELAKTGFGFPPTKAAMKEMKLMDLSPKILPLLKMYEAGWTRAIRATDYAGMVIEPCNAIMEGVLAKGANPDYPALMKAAAEQSRMAIMDAPKIE